jgi:hypothetical protein
LRHQGTLVTFIRKKRVGNNVYLYEVESVRNSDGSWSQRVVRYIGPVDPVYGGRGPVNLDEERERLAERDARRERI